MILSHRLPPGWVGTKLGNIAEQITKGTTPTTAGYKFQSSGIPFVKIENINTHGIDLGSISQFISEETHAALARSQFIEGDVLFSIAGTIGKTAVITSDNLPANTNQAVAIIRGTLAAFDQRFLRQQLRAASAAIAKNKARGGAMNNISLGDLKEVELSMPPLAEQKQIAAKLDELLAQVDTLKTRLDAVPAILKRFRQSVLAAAVSGRLTEEWRASVQVSNVCDSIAGCDQIAKDKKTAAMAEKEFFTEELLFEIPDSWQWARLCRIAEIVSGVAKGSKTKEETVEVPYLRVANVQRGYLDLNEIKLITVPVSKAQKLYLKFGDVLFNEGGDLDKLGRGWVWEEQVQDCIHQNHVFRARLYDEKFEPRFVSYYGNSAGKDYFIKVGSQTVNLANINKTSLSLLPVPVPPEEEQTEIVHRVEQLFSFAEQIEQRLKAAQSRVNHLTQSILAKAFRGELTADWREQNPDLISGEHSAAALLERIKSERSVQNPPKKQRRKKLAST